MRTKSIWAWPLAVALLGAQAQQQGGKQAIPDAPRPQAPVPTGGVTPGAGSSGSAGSSSASSSDSTQSAPEAQVPMAAPSQPVAPSTPQTPPPGSQGQTEATHGPTGSDAPTIAGRGVFEVNIAFTVKDAKNRLVPGITCMASNRCEVQIFENGRMQKILRFADDAKPLSVAIVIDQSMSHSEMDTVNTTLGALQDAFTKYDEISVFSYNKSPKQVTDFTGAQSPRAAQAIEVSKASGRDAMLAGSLGGPLAQNTIVNDQNFDPNTRAVRGHSGLEMNVPREVHPLNDAILAAATALSAQPVSRRRVIYVISNGNEYGSQTSTKQLLKYLEVNGIEVDGSLVGLQTSLPVIGMLDRIHLPLMMRDNALTPLANATGGNVDAEFRVAAIERGFAQVASEARNRYIVTYDTTEPFIDGKYRSLNITILRPGLTVIAPPGYYPESQELRQQQRIETPPPAIR